MFPILVNMLRFLIAALVLICMACDTNKGVLSSTESINYLALGDSYTIGESVVESGRWPEQLRDSLMSRGVSVGGIKIIATTGWRTDDLSSAMDNERLKDDYNLVSLLIGVNNQYQGRSVEAYKPEFETLLNRAIRLAGGDKKNVFVVSIPDYAFTPFGQKGDSDKISSELESYNAACKEITIANGVQHIDITGISKEGIAEPELVAKDGLHPSAKQYTLWVEKILNEKF